MAAAGDGIRNIRFAVLESADRLSHPLLRRLLADWQDAAGTAGLPGHAFVDPVRLKYLLGALLVIGVARGDRDAMRFHYRLIGTDVVARIGRDFTGLWMDEHADPEVARDGPPACRLAVDSRRPVHVTARREIFHKRYPLEYLILPLAAGDGAPVDRLVIGQLYPADAPRLPYGGEGA
jgi:hypothetical protein